MDTNQSNNGGIWQASAYHLVPSDGGTDRQVANVVTVTNGNTAIVTLDGPIQAAKHYQLALEPNITDCLGDAVEAGPYALQYQLCLLPFEGTAWKYYTNSGATPLGTQWRLDPNFDDSGWADGVALFDGKTPNRTNVSGFGVTSQLPLRDPNYDAGNSDIPVYLFRTHFNLPTAPMNVLSLDLLTVSDDFDVCWLNNLDLPAHIRPGAPALIVTNADYNDFSGGLAVADAAQEGPFPINPTNLFYGQNLICAKEFQVNSTSSDITFSYQLVAIVDQFKPPGPRLAITIEGSNVHITWTPGDGTLYQADAVEGDWTVVATQSAGEAVVAYGGPGMFFTLRK